MVSSRHARGERGERPRSADARLARFSIPYVLGRSLSIWASHALPWTLLAAGLLAPAYLYRAGAGLAAQDDLLFTILQDLALVLGWAVLLPVAFRDAVGRAESLGFDDLVRRGLRHVFGLAVLLVLWTVGASLALRVGGALGAIGQGMYVVSLAVLVAAFVVWIRLFVALPACVVGGVGPIEALRASWRLTRGFEAHLIVSWLALLVPLVLLVLAAHALLGSAVPNWVVDYVFAVASLPLWGAFMVVVYVELRVAQEGLEREALAAAV